MPEQWARELNTADFSRRMRKKLVNSCRKTNYFDE